MTVKKTVKPKTAKTKKTVKPSKPKSAKPKAAKTKTAKPKAVKSKTPKKSAKGKSGGEVTHYFDKIQVAVVKLNTPLKIGDKVHFTGSADFEQVVDSMQIDHNDVRAVKKGRWVAIKVEKAVKEKDTFSKI